ncbi:hypothetical protein C7M53_22975 (plasmid) [Bacillus licheniformis]|nr:hypothetical protein C7M53_22975 [Bacillus licheniformis]
MRPPFGRVRILFISRCRPPQPTTHGHEKNGRLPADLTEKIGLNTDRLIFETVGILSEGWHEKCSGLRMPSAPVYLQLPRQMVTKWILCLYT